MKRKKRDTKNVFKLPSNPFLKSRAKALRKARNLPEVLFWNRVKRHQFLGLDFDRQRIIGYYIVDFYCPNAQVIIEIDGSSHIGKEDYDRKRDLYLESLGLTVIHLKVGVILHHLDHTMHVLKQHDAFAPFNKNE